MSSIIQTISNKFDKWLMSSEPNAAGRLGLFRIVYVWFYLWYLSSNFAIFLKHLPQDYYVHRILMIEFLPTQLMTQTFSFVETILVIALVMLLIGFRTRISTAIILVCGCFLEACYSSVDYERGMVFMVFYIPFYMFLDNHWGETYSLDSILNQRKYHTDINPSDSNGKYFVVPRVILILISALFFSSAVFKILGTWLTFPDLIADLMLSRSVEASIYGIPVNPLAPFIAQTPIIYHTLRLFTLVFEGGFFLCLFSRKLRNIFIPLALIFHSVNALYLVVSFTPVLIVYLLFIDLQHIKQKILFKPIIFLQKIPSTYIQIGSITIAVIIGIFWNSNVDVRSLINLWGIIDWRTIWYPVLPIAIVWLVVSIIDIFKVNSSPSI